MTPAAIITFHPDHAWPARLDAIRREHPRVLVVDNSTAPDARAFVAATLAGRPGVTLHPLLGNPGIGTALNLAFSILSNEGFVAVVAYDQDSTPAPGFTAALSATARKFPRAAVIGASWTDPRRPGQAARFLCSAGPFGLGFRRVPVTDDLNRLLCVITSGTRFDLSSWQKTGGFADDLFLDLVDTDYCLRVRKTGREIAACAAARLLHHRGEKRPVRVLGRDFYPAHTPPFRLRCLSRNRVLLFRRHRLRPVAWTSYELAYTLKLLTDALFFEDHKPLRIKAMLAGTWDGIKNRSGAVRPA